MKAKNFAEIKTLSIIKNYKGGLQYTILLRGQHLMKAGYIEDWLNFERLLILTIEYLHKSV